MNKCGICREKLSYEESFRFKERNGIAICDQCAHVAAVAYAEWHGGTVDLCDVLSCSSVPQKTRKRVFARDKNTCLCCGTKENITIDHIRPRSQGGGHSLSNLQTLCLSCNSKKGTQTIKFGGK